MAKSKDTNQDRERAISLALGAIEKQFGKGSIMRLGEGDAALQKIPTVPSGSVGLDIALGIGGYPRGRIIEVYGPESSGKTTLTLHAIAEAQKLNSCFPREDQRHTPVVNQPQGYQKPCAAAVWRWSSSETNGGCFCCSQRENETPRICPRLH